MEKIEFDAFQSFVEAPSESPSKDMDRDLIGMVQKDLNPDQKSIYARFTLIQLFSGCVTLAVCPQFGIGFGTHNPFLHSLHIQAGPFWFHLLCGVFFMFFGAFASGLLLTKDEIRTIKRTKYPFFMGYVVVSCLVFSGFGVNIMFGHALAWILGAFIGNLTGFESSARIAS